MADPVAMFNGFVSFLGNSTLGVFGFLSGLGATVVGFLMLGALGYWLWRRFG